MKPQRKPPQINAQHIARAAAINHAGSILISESNRACQSIPLVAFHKSAIDSKIRMVGHARFRIDFHLEGGLGVDWGIELIGIRIMPCAPKVLNLDYLLCENRTLPVAAEAKVKFRQHLAKARDF